MVGTTDIPNSRGFCGSSGSVKNNFYRDPLDNLDIIPRRIFGGQQAESCPGPLLNAVNMSVENHSRISIDTDGHL